MDEGEGSPGVGRVCGGGESKDEWRVALWFEIGSEDAAADAVAEDVGEKAGDAVLVPGEDVAGCWGQGRPQRG